MTQIFFQAYFSSSSNLSLPFKTLFINFSPIQQVPITFEGLIPQLNTFSANQKKNLYLCALALIASSDNFPEPAGESNTNSSLSHYIFHSRRLKYIHQNYALPRQNFKCLLFFSIVKLHRCSKLLYLILRDHSSIFFEMIGQLQKYPKRELENGLLDAKKFE